ncbi:MAG: SDR family oxidoreductase [Clostridia bacterium]|jgi:NAD(P)-dependent dehydrogenase (short-subunit alcohol dehydrogenase family)|nr:SDR family oxidoreductase [Clostridia bacterium]MBT7123253.1 SDR family oxidoreductase [Clostridia bacterium]
MKKTSDKKVIVITGANAGIGIETLRGLLDENTKIVMACRDAEKSAPVCASFEKASGCDVDLMQLDLANLKSIEVFADAFNKKYDRLDVLINNAGVFCRKHTLTKDGFETTMGVNYYGTVYLTHLLLPAILDTGKARIVNLSSGAYYGGKLKLNKPSLGARSNFPAYAASKLALMYFSFELAARLKDRGVTVNSVNPGHSVTGIFPSDTWYWRLANKMIAGRAQTNEQAARTSIYAAIADELTGVTGKYLENGAITPVRENIFDAQMQKRLWASTCKTLDIDVDII